MKKAHAAKHINNEMNYYCNT